MPTRSIRRLQARLRAVPMRSSPSRMYSHSFTADKLPSLRPSTALPAMYGWREYAATGGLMAYGPNVAATQRRAASFVDRIIKGANPAEMPIEQPTQFDLVINLNTAKALGLEIPLTLLARADEVIE